MTARDSALRFSHVGRSVQPGEAVLYDIHSSLTLERLHIKAFERNFPAFTVDNGLQWNCLVGLDRDVPPGQYRIELVGVDLKGQRVTAGDVLDILPKEFPTRKLTIDPKYVSPPAEVLARIRKEQELVESIFTTTSSTRLWKGPFNLPVPGEVISEFGKRSIFNNQPRSAHSGTDFRGPVGTPIRAPNSGRVVLTSDLYYSGKTVILDHGMGMYSYLAHMSEIMVKEGDSVEKGSIVGKVGATGRVTGPHLHWTVRLRISRIDPISLVSILENYGDR